MSGAAVYRLLADAVVLLHFAFILFVILGGLLSLRWRRGWWLHVPAALYGAGIELVGWHCPLTDLENWLRRESGAAVYSASFIERYLLPVIYPAGLTREIQLFLGAAVILLNAVVYLFVVRRRRRPAE